MKHIVFLTGAGISAESGLSTFRGKDGLWTKAEFEYLASLDCLKNETQRSLDFYNMRRENLAKVHPNQAHKQIAELEKFFKVSVITQNVDNLHEMAGSTKVVHLHGELMKGCSSRDTENPHFWRTMTADDYEVKPGEKAADGSLLRPYIVFFQENVPNIYDAIEEARKADIFIIIGTSLNVYPAASLMQYVPASAEVYLIDPNPARANGVTVIQKGASEGMKELMTVLRSV